MVEDQRDEDCRLISQSDLLIEVFELLVVALWVEEL